MLFTEQKLNGKWVYFNEDIYGSTEIISDNKLDPDTLDEIVGTFVIEKKIKKGHTKGIKFEATYKDQWADDNKDEKDTGFIIKNREVKKMSWWGRLLNKLKLTNITI